MASRFILHISFITGYFFTIIKSKIMKQKITLLLMATFILANAFAQKPSIGFTEGLTSSSWKATVDNETETTDSRIGFTAGIVAAIPISSNFSFMPSLNFVQKGFESSFGDAIILESTLNYLEMPLNFVYNRDGFFFGAGPAISFGITGNGASTYNGRTEEEDIKFGSEDDEMKSTEFSANFLTGYQFNNGFLISLNYNLGLSNIMNSNVDNEKLTNRYFGLRIGYMFMKRK